eukprot:486513_1
MQQKVECNNNCKNNNITNRITNREENQANIINFMNNENIKISELVCDLKQLQNIENNNNVNNINTIQQNQMQLKQSIEQKIRTLVHDVTNKVLDRQNSNGSNIKNDIIHAQQVINNSFDLLN